MYFPWRTTSTFWINFLFSSFGEEHSIWREFTLEMSYPFVFASFTFLMMSSGCFSPSHLPVSVFTKNQLTYFKFIHFCFSPPSLVFSCYWIFAIYFFLLVWTKGYFCVDFSFCFVNEFIVGETLWGCEWGLFWFILTPLLKDNLLQLLYALSSIFIFKFWCSLPLLLIKTWPVLEI